MLRKHLNVFVVAYLNNVLIYSKTHKDYQQHVRKVLEIFKRNSVKLAPYKAEWFKEEVEFLKVIVGVNKVCMLEDKIKAVLKWPTPTNVKEVQAFIKFSNFY
jgi:hypothetical protein